MSDLPAWAHPETDEEEIARMAPIYRAGASSRIIGLATVQEIKWELNDTPRWRLLKRWRLVRIAKAIVKEHDLSG